MTKVVSVLPTNKKITYKQALQTHINNLTDEELDREVSMFQLQAITSGGIVYSVLVGDDALSAIGLLETVKVFLMQESF